jgi:tetratricopeptide (TPR) repeat protein
MTTRFIRGLIICLLVATAHSYAWAAPDRAIQPLLAEKWQASAAVLLANEAQQSDPVVRLLIGYVALASNHTNEAMAMFASVQDLDGLRRWREWTEQLARANPSNRVAALLAIDAQARLGEVTDGTRAMQALLEKQPRFALAYDLAGALAILRDDKASAREAFKTATGLDPRLADAWISRGSLEAIARTPLDVPQLGNVRSADVLGYFATALKLDPTSAPARLGRGVILYGLGRFPEAAEAFADAKRVAPWLGLAVYNDMQSDLAVLRRYALQAASSERRNGPGTTLQMTNDRVSQLLDEQAYQSSGLLAQTLAQAGSPAATLDPKVLDTATPSQLQELVKTYGLATVELANAARLDANSAELFQLNTQIQKDMGALSFTRNAWEATYNLALAQSLVQAASDLKTPEVGLELGLLRITGTLMGMAAGNTFSPYQDNQPLGKIAVSRLFSVTTAASIAAAQGTDVESAMKTAAGTPRLSDLAIGFKAAFGVLYATITQLEDAATVHVGWANHDLANARFLSSSAATTSSPASGPPRAVMAPGNYSLDAGAQAALINVVAQSVRGSSVVLVAQDPTQSISLQQAFNRQGVATQTAQTPQAGIDLAKQSGASWVIGANGHFADPPNNQSSNQPLKPPDILPSCWGCGGPRPQPLGVGGGSPPPPPPPSTPVNWSGFQPFTPPPSPNMPGGVRTFTDAMIDDGRWPVHVPLTLCLPVVLTAGAGGSSKAR